MVARIKLADDRKKSADDYELANWKSLRLGVSVEHLNTKGGDFLCIRGFVCDSDLVLVLLGERLVIEVFGRAEESIEEPVNAP